MIITTSNTDINKENVKEWLNYFDVNIKPELVKLREYYEGKNLVVKQQAVANRPNYSVKANIAYYISQVQTGYFMGKPVSYEPKVENGKEKEIDPKIPLIFSANNEEEHNFSVAADMSCYGVGYEVLAVDKETASENVSEKNLKIGILNPENCFYVYDDSVLRKPVCAITYRYVKESKDKTVIKGYIYDKTTVRDFTTESLSADLTIGEEVIHGFVDIPVIKYKNNKDEFGDYQQVQELLNSISLSLSNGADDLQSIANAFLTIAGAAGTGKEDIALINTSRIAKLPVGGKMEWVVKNINIDAVKYYLDQTLNLVYQISGTPDLTSEEFAGQQSGVAMEYKLWGLEQARNTKERYFRTALIQRLYLISNILSLSNGESYEIKNDVDIIFYKNMPQSDDKTYAMVNALNGVISTKTLLSQLSMVKDVDAEIDLINEEKKAELDLLNSNGIN